MKSACLLFLCIVSFRLCFAQPGRQVDSLHKIYLASVSTPEKVNALSSLATYYYSNKFFKAGDSVLSEQLRIARLSKDQELILQTYFHNYITSISNWSSTEYFDRAIQFLKSGIDFASSIQEYDYTAIGYTQMAGILRKMGDGEKALENATFALDRLPQIKSDSVKAVVYIELGDCYQAKSESVEACKSYNQAFDIALRSENHSLESNINYRLSDLNYTLGDTIEAKKQLYKSVVLHHEHENGEALIRDYTELARVTDNSLYIDTVFSIAHSLHLENKIFRAKRILLAIYAYVLKDSEKALNYLKADPELTAYYKRSGMSNYYFYIGQVYRYDNKPDSALVYLKLAEPGLLKDFSLSVSKYLYQELAICYELKSDTANAILNYEKILKYSEGGDDLANIADISNSLSLLYRQKGDFEKAYNYKLLASRTQDTLLKLRKDKELVLLGVDRETKKHEEELRQEKERLEKKHSIQYLGITIAICIIFLCFLLLGMFPVSKLAIKIFGYIYFISVFEFIILLIEHSVLHPITHGDPLKLWLLKIVLIAMLVPVQQFLEHGLIHYLQSRKLMSVRTKFSSFKWWKKKKPLQQTEEIDEEDMGIL